MWCERGSPLLESSGVSAEHDAPMRGSSDQSAADGCPEGAVQIRSETDGTVYLRPSPEADNYVTVGSVCTAKETVALVEVMKT